MAGMFPPVHAGEKARTASTGFFQTLVQDARSANADTIRDGDEDRTFYRLPIYKRVIIMCGGPFMNLVIAVVLFGVVLCGFGMQQLEHHHRQRQRLPAARHQRAPDAVNRAIRRRRAPARG